MSKQATSSRPFRGLLIASWLVLAGPIFLVGLSFLIVLKTGKSLLGMVERAGMTMPEALVSNPSDFFTLDYFVCCGWLSS